MENRRKQRPALPKLMTNFDYHDSPRKQEKRKQERKKDKPLMPDSLLREVSRRLSSVGSCVGILDSANMVSPVATIAPFSTPVPIDNVGRFPPVPAGGSIGWATPNQPQPQPYPSYGSYYGYPDSYPQFQQSSIAGNVPLLPSHSNPVSRIVQVNEGMNREKLLMEEYRYPGMQQSYQAPHCAVNPPLHRYEKHTAQQRKTRRAYIPAKAPSSPFSFDPEAPEFHPRIEKPVGKATNENFQPFIVG